MSHAISSAHSFVLGLDGFEQSMQLYEGIIAETNLLRKIIFC